MKSGEGEGPAKPVAPLPAEFDGKVVGNVKEKSPPDSDVVGAPPFTHMPIIFDSSATSVTGLCSR
ncbi:MAG: hypothetical protein ACLFNY_02485 [Candidatus Aenigmatarchaeota archaeon]